MPDTPDMSVDVVSYTMTSTSNTFTTTYPAGRGPAHYGVGGDHRITARDFTLLSARSGHLTITFGPTTFTVVNNTDRQFKNGSVLSVTLDRAGYLANDGDAFPATANCATMHIASMYLGAPATAVANGFCASQDLTAAGVFSSSVTAAAAIAAASLAGDAGLTGRNVVAAWTGTAVITITGTDFYGNVLKESSASGTSLTGKKAFKTITGISVSANVTALTVGTGVLLGLPIFLESPAHAVCEILDGAKATAGTIVGGVTSTATATTGDVRGTVSPNSAPNGSRVFEIVGLVRSRAYKGITQYSG